DHQLLWADGGRIVFPWERDGWTHLYSVPSTGGAAAQLLTPGEFEVEYVSISSDRKQIVFNSNQDDIDRRHLWRVSPAGGEPSPLTSGTGIEWAPRVTSDGTIVFLRSDARRHPAPAWLSPRGPVDLVAPQADDPASSLVVPEPVVLTATDGMKIHAQLFRPAG